MFTALRKRNFALLWLGQIVSLSGDWLVLLALPFYIYQLTGSVLQTGIMYMIEMLPRILLGSLAGVFVDRWDRRWTMIIADLSRAAVLLLILLVHTQNLIWVIYVAVACQAIISQFFTPASMALIPTLVGEKDLIGANSLSSFSEALTRLIGPPLGGILYAWLSTTGVVVVDSATYLFSALMISLVAVPARTTVPQPQAVVSVGEATKNVLREWRSGLGIVKRDDVILGVFLTMGVLMIGQGVLNVMLVPLTEKVLHGGSVTLGWIITAQGVGSLLGALLVGQVSKVVRPVVLAVLALVATGSAILIITHYPHLLISLLLIGIVGVFIVGLMVTTQTLLQIRVEDSYRGRVFGAFETLLSIAMFAGLILATGAGDRLSTVTLLDISGILTLLAGVVALLTMSNARLKDDAQEEPSPSTPAIEVAPD
ncbi:MFS transporter [Ktedonobacter racemifer]|uniref:Major facilitator superfamily MFS_1 n=1 Tax=Ktedonobacter racemifer DSM 44963 TaxID=485913 RepID=D6TMB4_KTERA|nr:MFS transporter [Ktedonobacter racemifer]EFH86914.1 major facilitator superfamily MFS_1 [Ktedonobacter racemifer DSM 44963]